LETYWGNNDDTLPSLEDLFAIAYHPSWPYGQGQLESSMLLLGSCPR
jgi:hypothetical protein